MSKHRLPCWLLVGGLAWMPLSQAQIMGGVEVDPAREPQPVSPGLNPWVAQVKVLRSQAWVERDGRRLLVEVGMRLRQQDVLETGLAGAVGITGHHPLASRLDRPRYPPDDVLFTG